ncbi:MAG: MFS transporter [Patescibacteria group bacterium]
MVKEIFQDSFSRNIIFYFIFHILREPLFWGPVLIYYLQHQGNMSLHGIYFMETVVVLGFVILEVPSGALADLIGRRKTIMAGSFLYFLCDIIFSVGNAPWTMWVANVVWVVGASLCSGADSAFLYDSLKYSKFWNTDDYKKIEGKAGAIRFLLFACGSLCAGYLAEINVRLPALLSIPFVFVSFLATLFFKELKNKNKHNRQEHWSLMKTSVLFVANHKKIKWIIAFTMLLMVSGKIWFFTYNPYFEIIDLPMRYWGWLFFTLNIVAMIFSWQAGRILKKFGEYRSIIGLVFVASLPIFLMGSFVAIPAVLFVLFQNVVRGFQGPFLNQFLNDHLDSENRATVISIRSAVSGFCQAIGLGGFGLLLVLFSFEQNKAVLPFLLRILGGATLIVGIFLIFKFKKIFGGKKK